MSRPLIARFTPSLMAKEDLENLFVQRHDLAARIIDQIKDSVSTRAKHYNLIVGPRGIGKTHLISLLYHRVAALTELRPQMAIAWMREEEWGVTTFLDFCLRALRALDEAGEAKLPPERMEALYQLTAAQAEKAAAKLLLELLGERVLVLLVENLDDLFSGLADAGQKAFRSFLQENGRCTVVATSPGLFEAITRRQSPFFGFFRITHLTTLDVKETSDLFEKIARRKGDIQLADYILTKAGQARIRAIHYLGDGNPRVFAILSDFLTKSALDDLVQPFMRMLDDLTPYYQARMQWLSPQQRKIVEFLVNYSGAATVKTIAQRCFITQQTASSQLGKLANIGYVFSEQFGRESFYRLREPLMRFCLDVKRHHGSPLPLIVEILRAWFFPDELEDMLAQLSPQSEHREYLEQAVKKNRSGAEDPRLSACLRDYFKYSDSGHYKDAFDAAIGVKAIAGIDEAFILIVNCLHELDRLIEAIPLASERIASGTPIDDTECIFLGTIGVAALGSGDFALGKQFIGYTKQSVEFSEEIRTGSLAVANASLGLTKEAIEDVSAFLKTQPNATSATRILRIVLRVFSSKQLFDAVAELVSISVQAGRQREVIVAFALETALMIAGDHTKRQDIIDVFETQMKGQDDGSILTALGAILLALNSKDEAILTSLSDEQLMLVRPLLEARKSAQPRDQKTQNE